MFGRKRVSLVLTVCLAYIIVIQQACQHTAVTPTPNATPVKPTTASTKTVTLTPEPSHTPTSSPDIWNYVAFGDTSIISEAGADSYVTHYASYIAEDLGVQVETAFYTIEDVLVKDQLDRLRNDTELRDAISNAQVVSLATGDLDIIYPVISSYLWDSCGGEDNKDCIREAVVEFSIHYDAVLTEVLQLCQQDAIIRTMTLYTRSLHKVYGNDVDLKPFYTLLNEQVIEASQAHSIPVAMVHEAMEDARQSISNGYLNPAGWNPTESGAKTIADFHREQGYEITCP